MAGFLVTFANNNPEKEMNHKKRVIVKMKDKDSLDHTSRFIRDKGGLKKIMTDVKNNSSQLDNISEDNFIRLCKKFNDLVLGYGTVYEELHYFRNYINRAPITLNDMIQLNKNLPSDNKLL